MTMDVIEDKYGWLVRLAYLLLAKRTRSGVISTMFIATLAPTHHLFNVSLSVDREELSLL